MYAAASRCFADWSSVRFTCCGCRVRQFVARRADVLSMARKLVNNATLDPGQVFFFLHSFIYSGGTFGQRPFFNGNQ